MIRKPAKDGLGNNVRDYIFNPAENKFEHKDDLVHVSSYDMKSKEPKLGSPEHKQKFLGRYKSGYVDWWNRDKKEPKKGKKKVVAGDLQGFLDALEKAKGMNKVQLRFNF